MMSEVKRAIKENKAEEGIHMLACVHMSACKHMCVLGGEFGSGDQEWPLEEGDLETEI